MSGENLPTVYAPRWRVWYGLLNAFLIEVGVGCLIGVLLAPAKYKPAFDATSIICLVIFLIGLRLTRNSNGINENQPMD